MSDLWFLTPLWQVPPAGAVALRHKRGSGLPPFLHLTIWNVDMMAGVSAANMDHDNKDILLKNNMQGWQNEKLEKVLIANLKEDAQPAQNAYPYS